METLHGESKTRTLFKEKSVLNETSVWSFRRKERRIRVNLKILLKSFLNKFYIFNILGDSTHGQIAKL